MATTGDGANGAHGATSGLAGANGKRPGRQPGTAKTGGRKRGVPNKVSRDLRELILKRGKPAELLCDVARGKRIREGPQVGPGEPKYYYPSPQERIAAARELLPYVVGRMQQITGPDDGPLLGEGHDSNPRDLARSVLDILSGAKIGDPEGAERPVVRRGLPAPGGWRDPPTADAPRNGGAREASEAPRDASEPEIIPPAPPQNDVTAYRDRERVRLPNLCHAECDGRRGLFRVIDGAGMVHGGKFFTVSAAREFAESLPRVSEADAAYATSMREARDRQIQEFTPSADEMGTRRRKPEVRLGYEGAKHR